MARLRDETKRLGILAAARSLFAKKGFGDTSISDLVKETGYPVGTLYTYFPNKEEILRTIVDEGWTDLYNRLVAALEKSPTTRNKISTLIDQFLPELLDQGELVEIVLSEPEELTGLGSKMEGLTALLEPLLAPYLPERKRLKTALAVYFLGIIHASRLIQRINPGFDREDILTLVRDAVSFSIPRE